MHTQISWILASISLALLAGAGLLWLIHGRTPKAGSLPTEWTLTSRPVFSAEERRVYRQLREALPHHILLSKLPLVRFCQPTDPQEVRYWYQLLGAIHVAFAICSTNGRVLAAIDVEGGRTPSRRSQMIKQSVLAACRVRYLRCSMDHLPSIPELQLLVPHSGVTASGPQPAPTAGRAAGTPGSRRRGSTTLWQDSGFLQDSFFGDGARELAATSGFGGLRGSQGNRDDYSSIPDNLGGVVVDSLHGPLRH
jgi:hypothetical protein